MCTNFREELISVLELVNEKRTRYSYFFSVFRYRELKAEDEQVKWLWEILASFNKEELVSFLRFISGRSRLPEKLSDLPHKFQIVGADKVCLFVSFLLYQKHGRKQIAYL